jgi:hypothetical protein
MFGLSAISYDLLEKYPSIAKDHLSVEVDTGQIVSLNDFLFLYTYFPSFVGIKVSGVPFLTLLLPATDPREII